MYDPRRGSAGKLCSSNFNGRLPGEGGEQTLLCLGVRALRGAGSVVPVRRGWVPRPGCSNPLPGEPEPRCNRRWGSWVGDEPGAGALQDAWVLWNSWLQLPVSISSPGAAPPAPASVSPSLSVSPLHGAGRPLLHTPGFGAPPWPLKREGELGSNPAASIATAGLWDGVCSAALVLGVPGGAWSS